MFRAQKRPILYRRKPFAAPRARVLYIMCSRLLVHFEYLSAKKA